MTPLVCGSAGAATVCPRRPAHMWIPAAATEANFDEGSTAAEVASGSSDLGQGKVGAPDPVIPARRCQRRHGTTSTPGASGPRDSHTRLIDRIVTRARHQHHTGNRKKLTSADLAAAIAAGDVFGAEAFGHERGNLLRGHLSGRQYPLGFHRQVGRRVERQGDAVGISEVQVVSPSPCPGWVCS
jgi:hypothetical protein